MLRFRAQIAVRRGISINFAGPLVISRNSTLDVTDRFLQVRNRGPSLECRKSYRKIVSTAKRGSVLKVRETRFLSLFGSAREFGEMANWRGLERFALLGNCLRQDSGLGRTI